MFLVNIHYGIIIVFIVLFAMLILGITFLIIYYTRYIKQSSREKRKLYTDLNRHAKKGSIVFLGDSLTDFYRTNEFFLNDEIYNRGIAGDTTDDVLNRLYDNVINIAPRKLFLQIGTNDLGGRKKPDYIVKNIEKIVQKVLTAYSQCQIYIISLYPINPSAIPLSKIITMPRKNITLDAINNMLIEFCEKGGYTYIDVASHLKDEKGNLKKEYTIEGLHISLIGYEKITEILKPYIN